jgi:hypothetical protein
LSFDSAATVMVAVAMEALDQWLDVLDARLEVRVSGLELEHQVLGALNIGRFESATFAVQCSATQSSGDIGVSVIYRNTADYPKKALAH